MPMVRKAKQGDSHGGQWNNREAHGPPTSCAISEAGRPNDSPQTARQGKRLGTACRVGRQVGGEGTVPVNIWLASAGSAIDLVKIPQALAAYQAQSGPCVPPLL